LASPAVEVMPHCCGLFCSLIKNVDHRADLQTLVTSEWIKVFSAVGFDMAEWVRSTICHEDLLAEEASTPGMARLSLTPTTPRATSPARSTDGSVVGDSHA
jgi:hypothetical protein